MTASQALVLLDTNVLVHYLRADPFSERVESDHHLLDRRDRPLVALATVGELYALALKLSWGDARKHKLDEIVRELVVVYPHQGRIPQLYGEIDHYSEREVKSARPMGQNDMWIAATAAETDATLYTTDRDFDHLSPRFVQLVRLDAHTGATL